MNAATIEKPRSKPQRFVRIAEQPTADSDGWFALEIAVGRRRDVYLARLSEWHYGPALTFAVEKLDADLNIIENYRVTVSPEPELASCDCQGHRRHGHCKHREGIEALLRMGRLPVV